MKKIMLTLALLGLLLPMAAPAQADVTPPALMPNPNGVFFSDSNGLTIFIDFNEPMQAFTSTSLNGFNLTTNGGFQVPVANFGSLTQGGFRLVMTLSSRAFKDDVLILGYSHSNIKDVSGNSLATFTNRSIDTSGLSPRPPLPVVQSAILASDGTMLTINFNTDMGFNQDSRAWTIKRGNSELAYTPGTLSLGNPRRVFIFLDAPAQQGESLTLEYRSNVTTNGTVPFASANGDMLISFFQHGPQPELTITNNSTISLPTRISRPTLTLNGGSVVSTASVWSNGASPTGVLWACRNPITPGDANSGLPGFLASFCARLVNPGGGLANAGIEQGDIPGQSNSVVPFSVWSGTYRHILRFDTLIEMGVTFRTYSGTMEYISGPGSLLTPADSPSLSPTADSPSLSPTAEEEDPVAVPFGGPSIASFVKAAASTPSNQLQFVGKRMNKVTSASVGGLQATISATRSSLSITVPEGLAPGIYNLVLESTDGRITIMRFVTVR